MCNSTIHFISFQVRNTCSTAAPCSQLLNTLDRGRGGSLGFVALSGHLGAISTRGVRGARAGAGAGPGPGPGAGGEGLSSRYR